MHKKLEYLHMNASKDKRMNELTVANTCFLCYKFDVPLVYAWNFVPNIMLDKDVGSYASKTLNIFKKRNSKNPCGKCNTRSPISVKMYIICWF